MVPTPPPSPIPPTSPIEPPLAGAGHCNAAAARRFDGQPGTAALIARGRTAAGAAVVRTLRPGVAGTMDYREDRLTIMLDTAGVITALRCG